MDDISTIDAGASCLPSEASFARGCEPLTAEDAPIFDTSTGNAVEPDGEPSAAGVGDDPHAPERVLEALLFATDAPLPAARLSQLIGGITPKIVAHLVGLLNGRYERAGASFRIEAIARGYQIMTLATYQPWIDKLNRHRSETRLSEASLETLAIVAYKQPIIRADIEALRGVGCGVVLTRLREMGLIRVAGRAEVVGRPLLYETTRKFLDAFGLADLDDLPRIEALKFRPASAPEAAGDEDRVKAEPARAASA